MQGQLAELFNDTDYEEESEINIYEDYRPHKMTKREFVREMMRLQEEREFYAD